MKKENNIYVLSNFGFILHLLKKKRISFMNKMKYNFSYYNLDFIKKINSDNNSENDFIDNK